MNFLSSSSFTPEKIPIQTIKGIANINGKLHSLHEITRIGRSDMLDNGSSSGEGESVTTPTLKALLHFFNKGITVMFSSSTMNERDS